LLPLLAVLAVLGCSHARPPEVAVGHGAPPPAAKAVGPSGPRPDRSASDVLDAWLECALRLPWQPSAAPRHDHCKDVAALVGPSAAELEALSPEAIRAVRASIDERLFWEKRPAAERDALPTVFEFATNAAVELAACTAADRAAVALTVDAGPPPVVAASEAGVADTTALRALASYARDADTPSAAAAQSLMLAWLVGTRRLELARTLPAELRVAAVPPLVDALFGVETAAVSPGSAPTEAWFGYIVDAALRVAPPGWLALPPTDVGADERALAATQAYEALVFTTAAALRDAATKAERSPLRDDALAYGEALRGAIAAARPGPGPRPTR
jgi:hypothetical protein